MKWLKLLTFTLLLMVVEVQDLSASLSEWRETRFELVGKDVPVLQSMDELRSVFSDPLVCSACRQGHYFFWSTSYHAKSIQNAGFQALYKSYLQYLNTEEAIKELGREPNANELRQCLFCHAPQVQFASDKLVQQISDAIVAGRWDEIRGHR
jgi:hypothetical protein